MHRVDDADYVLTGGKRLFKDSPIPGTLISAGMLNAYQEELVNVIEESGQTLAASAAADAAAVWGQLKEAVYRLSHKKNSINAIKYNSGALTAATLNAAIAAIGSDVKTLFIPAGNWTINANVDFSATSIHLVMETGAIFVQSAAFTVTLPKRTTFTLDQHFSGDLDFINITLANKTFPQWWGTFNDDSGDDAPAIIRAIRATQRSSGATAVELIGQYYIRQPITFSRPASGENRFELIGMGQRTSRIDASSSIGTPIAAMLLLEAGSGNIEDLRFENFMLVGTSKADMGIDLTAAHAPDCVIDRIRISGTLVAACKTKTYDIQFQKCIARSNTGDGFWCIGEENNAVNFIQCGSYANGGLGFNIKGGNTLNIYACTIEGNKKGGILFGGPMRGVSIEGNYFEGNGMVGYPLTVNAVVNTIKADIICNGGSIVNYSRAFPTTTVSIRNNSHNGERTVDGKADYAYFLISADRVVIENNRHMATMGSNLKLVGVTYDVGTSRAENVRINGNVGFSTYTVIPYTGLTGGAFVVGEYAGIGSGTTFTALGKIIHDTGAILYLETSSETSIFPTIGTLVNATLAGLVYTAGAVAADYAGLFHHPYPVWLDDSIVDSSGNTMRLSTFSCDLIPKRNYYDSDPLGLEFESSSTSGATDVAISGSTAGADTIQTDAQAYETGDRVNITLNGGSAFGVISGAFANSFYYWIKVDSTNGKIALTLADALAGTAVDITGDIGIGIVRPFNGTLIREAYTLHGNPVYTLDQKLAFLALSGRIKFTIDLDQEKYKHLRGKLVYFGMWGRQKVANMATVIRFNSIFNNIASEFKNGTDWKRIEHVAYMPYSGTVECYIQFTAPDNASSAWGINFSNPVISEIGVPWWEYESSSYAYRVVSNHQRQGANVASATDITLGGDGNVFNVTGVTTIDRIYRGNWQDGDEVILHFTGVLTMRHRAVAATGGGMAPINLNAGANLVTAANTRIKLYLDGGEWWQIGSASLLGNATMGIATVNTRLNVGGATDSASWPLNVNGAIVNAAASITNYGVGVPGDTNYERMRMRHDGSTASIIVEAAGTGTMRDFFIVINGANLLQLKPGGPKILSGSGTPEGAITAPVGSIWLRSNGGAATSFYVKESGAGNTGWVAK